MYSPRSFNSKIFFSYLKGRKHNVKKSNTYSVFQVFLSGFSQGSNLGPILFSIFINDLLLWNVNTELQNFADDNTISCTEKFLEKLIKSLTSESEKAVRWFLEIDSKLNFDEHITQLCRKSASQLNALCRLKSFLNTNQRKILVNSFIYSNYNYCPLVWHFCSKKSMNKIERIQYRALQFLHNDYNSDYNTLLKKSDKCSMEVRRLRTIASKIFKSLNDLNPLFIKELLNKRNNVNRRKNDLIIYTRNTVTFGSNSLRCLGPHIWNTLPQNIKEITSFEKCKESINSWYEPSRKCNLCC